MWKCQYLGLLVYYLYSKYLHWEIIMLILLYICVYIHIWWNYNHDWINGGRCFADNGYFLNSINSSTALSDCSLFIKVIFQKKNKFLPVPYTLFSACKPSVAGIFYCIIPHSSFYTLCSYLQKVAYHGSYLHKVEGKIQFLASLVPKIQACAWPRPCHSATPLWDFN